MCVWSISMAWQRLLGPQASWASERSVMTRPPLSVFERSAATQLMPGSAGEKQWSKSLRSGGVGGGDAGSGSAGGLGGGQQPQVAAQIA